MANQTMFTNHVLRPERNAAGTHTAAPQAFVEAPGRQGSCRPEGKDRGPIGGQARPPPGRARNVTERAEVESHSSGAKRVAARQERKGGGWEHFFRSSTGKGVIRKVSE